MSIPMNVFSVFKYTASLVLIAIYLAMPVAVLAGSAPNVFLSSVPGTCCELTQESSHSCPCPGDAGSSCCDSPFCTCACHAPLGYSFRIAYAPVVATQMVLEPSWYIPEVYRSIFVPPQNQV